MVNNNGIPIEVNKKPFETVQELKNETQSVVGDQIPSFEEFMKTYEGDSNLNYADLGGGVGETKGYGPCPDGCYMNSKGDYVYYKTPNTSGTSSDYGKYCSCTGSSRFCLKVQCYNWLGDGGSFYACSTANALDCARALENDEWYSAKVISDEVLLKCATLVREAIRRHDNGYRVKGYVKVEGKFWTGYESSYNY